MKKYYLIGAGGALGALLRFQIKNIPDLFYATDQLINGALNILLINLIGSLLLGILNAVFSKSDQVNDDVKLGLTTGLLGAFTTFSTFCKESILMIDAGYSAFFLFYLIASLSLGVIAVYLGHLMGSRIVYPLINYAKTSSEIERY